MSTKHAPSRPFAAPARLSASQFAALFAEQADSPPPPPGNRGGLTKAALALISESWRTLAARRGAAPAQTLAKRAM